jgi:hypothetical protein
MLIYLTISNDIYLIILIILIFGRRLHEPTVIQSSVSTDISTAFHSLTQRRLRNDHLDQTTETVRSHDASSGKNYEKLLSHNPPNNQFNLSLPV